MGASSSRDEAVQAVGAVPHAWWAALCVRGRLYAVPCNAEGLLVYDPEKATSSTVDTRRVATGPGKWRSAVALGGRIYGIPDRAEQLLVYDIASGVPSGVPTREIARGPLKWQSAAALAGKVYGVPFNAEKLLVYDPATGKVSGISLTDHERGEAKWLANVVVGGKLYGIPCDAPALLVYEPRSGALSAITTEHVASGPLKWLAAIGHGGKIYGIPCEAECVLVYDPVCGRAWGIDTSSVATGPAKWASAVAVGQLILGVPDHAEALLVVDTMTGEVSGVDTTSIATGPFKWQSGVAHRGRLYCMPHNAEQRLVYDPNSGEAMGVDTGHIASGAGKWGMALILGGRVCGVPFDSDQILLHTVEGGGKAGGEEPEESAAHTLPVDLPGGVRQELVEDFVACWLSQWIYHIKDIDEACGVKSLVSGESPTTGLRTEEVSSPYPVASLSINGQAVEFQVLGVHEEPMEGSPARLGMVLATLPPDGRRVVFIVFKGSSFLPDFVVNASVSPDYSPFAQTFGDRTTFVHHGAYHAIVQLRIHKRQLLRQQLTAAVASGAKQLVITGHSLGGQYALAFLLEVFLEQVGGADHDFGAACEGPLPLLDGARSAIFGSPMCFGSAEGADVRQDLVEFVRARSVNYVVGGDPAPRLWSELDIEGFMQYMSTRLEDHISSISAVGRRLVDWAAGPGGIGQRMQEVLRRPDIEAQLLRPASRYLHLSRIRLLTEEFRPWRPLGQEDIRMEDHSIKDAYLPKFRAALDPSPACGLFEEDGRAVA